MRPRRCPVASADPRELFPELVGVLIEGWATTVEDDRDDPFRIFDYSRRPSPRSGTVTRRGCVKKLRGEGLPPGGRYRMAVSGSSVNIWRRSARECRRQTRADRAPVGVRSHEHAPRAPEL
jgi:hypothetical protein